MQATFRDGAAVLSDLESFHLERSCTCGQAFRWLPSDEGGYSGVVMGRLAELAQNGDKLTIRPCGPEDLSFWVTYLDLERDYGPIEETLSQNARLEECLLASSGIRIFRQEPFETLISFILSANNNVGRISGTVEAISRRCGRPLAGGRYAFPTPAQLCKMTDEELRACGAGYRAPFIAATARIVAEGFDLDSLRLEPTERARKALAELPGVGPKVADCVLLFSLGHCAAFPMDVWMKRAARVFLADGKEPEKARVQEWIRSFGQNAGIVQQYIFYYMRKHRIGRGA
ncbi:MAG: DNA glycosylase [Bacillota bacterium]